MSIEAEDVVNDWRCHCEPDEDRECWSCQKTALVRALEAVRVAATQTELTHAAYCPALYERPQGCTCGIHALEEALAACDKIRSGT